MTLEEQLIERLINTYQLKGKNVQLILDNQLFKDLPLDKKVAFIKKYSEQLGTAPQAHYSNGAIGAGLLGAFSGLATVSAKAGKSMTTNKALLAAGIGTAGFIGLNALANRVKYKNDLETANNIAEGNSLDALVARTLQKGQIKLREPDPYTPVFKALDLVGNPALAATFVRN